MPRQKRRERRLRAGQPRPRRTNRASNSASDSVPECPGTEQGLEIIRNRATNHPVTSWRLRCSCSYSCYARPRPSLPILSTSHPASRDCSRVIVQSTTIQFQSNENGRPSRAVGWQEVPAVSRCRSDASKRSSRSTSSVRSLRRRSGGGIAVLRRFLSGSATLASVCPKARSSSSGSPSSDRRAVAAISSPSVGGTRTRGPPATCSSRTTR